MGEASDMSFPLTRVPCGAQGQSVEEARARQMELYPWRKPLRCVVLTDAGAMRRAGAERGGGARAAGPPGQDAQPALPPGGQAQAPGQDQVQGLPPPRAEGRPRQGGLLVLTQA